MNRNKLKTYAPQARRDFIQAVTDRATHFGLTAKKIEPMTEQGEVVLIGGRPFPKSVGAKRKKLEARIQRLGLQQTMEAMAYTWFNRLVAIRFMELHEYLEHGFRVLSSPEGHPQPEILEHAQHVDLPGLDQKKVVELKLDGTKEEELYRLLLIAQCNALHKALPFLFESIDDETELLLPDRLLHSDSLIRNLVNEIPEEDWQEVEIIGWLYQFYISDKKDEVIGKVVASEDIPAATQLFTPNWIVKYLVQNTLGRQWMATYPNSPLKGQMEYYIEPAEQTPEVQEQLKAITPTSLEPEELTLLDPACGSGHILVEAYDLFKAIYEERGRRPKDIPALILTKNLFGLEIDDRAAQLAAFALMMKARADDRRIFDSDAKPNIVAIQDSRGLDAVAITHALNSPINKEDVPKESLFEEIDEKNRGLFSKAALAEKGHVSQADIATLLELFENGKTFGSLIQIPPKLATKLPDIEKRLDAVLKHGDLTHVPAQVLKPLLQQARLLARQYDAVVVNPPYLNSKGMMSSLKSFAVSNFSDSKSDTFAMFIERCFPFLLENGITSFVTPFVWMFLSSYDDMRRNIVEHHTLTSLIQLEYNAFEPACVPVCAFTILGKSMPSLKADFIRLCSFRGHATQSVRTLEAIHTPTCGWRYTASSDDFTRIPGEPIAYWLGDGVLQAFAKGIPLGQLCKARSGLKTWDNERFLRLWFEVPFADVHCADGHSLAQNTSRWVPYNKGGPARKWSNHTLYCVDWLDNGREIKKKGPPTSEDCYFREGITWSGLTSSEVTFRYSGPGHIFDTNKGPMMFPQADEIPLLLGFLNSRVVSWILPGLNPTLGTQNGDIDRLPVLFDSLNRAKVVECVRELVTLTQSEWDEREVSRSFSTHPLVSPHSSTLSQALESFLTRQTERLQRIGELEAHNDRLFLLAYGLTSDKIAPSQISLEPRSSEEMVRSLLSYFVGCVMGRYSLSHDGITYAGDGGRDFPSASYARFAPDSDGILLLLERDWGRADDPAKRFEEFLAAIWSPSCVDGNLQLVAEYLGGDKAENPRDVIRSYFACDFYKDHLQLYKGPKHPPRPIYWLFSSGKQRGFQALVYLHRYNEGTLARMRTEYVIPLLGKMTARINHLTNDITSATSSQHRKRLETEKATITKQLAEVQAFDEKLRHCADQRIKLDLDDGVKVNYGKFGDLLADVKAVCGTKDEE